MKKLAAACIVAFALTGCSAQESTLVRLAAHDSFVISDELIQRFETETGFELEVLRLGDTGSLTNQLIVTKRAPIADAFFGIDNTFLGRALDEGIVTGSASPIDYSDVCFNYDVDWFADQAMSPPASWRDLIEQRYRGLTVVTNPNTSSPGLAFLATTRAGLANDDQVSAYWSALRENDVKVAGSWEDAYFADFTRYGGSYPIVLSYSSSPAAEVKPDGTPGSAALLEECFRQTEYAGVIQGSANERGAAALVAFLQSPDFQASVPEAMFVYPAAPGIALPEEWARFAGPARSIIGEGLDINANREAWLQEWSGVFGK